MTLESTRVRHICKEHGDSWRIEADIEQGGKHYWWGIINGVRLNLSIAHCPYCGESLPQPQKEAAP